jgi:hypothetical protein
MRYGVIWFTAVLFFTLSGLFFSCGTLSNFHEKETIKPAKSPTILQKKPIPEAPPASIERESGLDQRIFSNLSIETRDYLGSLARAFKKHDTDYLVKQGEEHYARKIQGRYSEEEYLALLFRAGPYAKESPFGPETMVRLDVHSVIGIRFTGLEDRGPVLDVRGSLKKKDGTELPFRILVLWKLREPKILGMET